MRRFETPTVYIAGPMTGMPEFNFPAFDAAAAEWRKAGWNVVNPAELDRDLDCSDWTHEEFMARDIPYVILAHAVALLPGWQDSKGAVFEHYTARYYGKRLYDARRPAPPPPTHQFTGEDGNNGCCILPDYAHFDYWLAHAA